MMTLVACTIVPTATLSPALARELVELAADAVGPSFDPRYVERRFARYPSVAIAFDRRGIAAFELLDTRRRAMDLVYLGPLFSRRGAFVSLFAHCLERSLESGAPFCVGMEIENPLVLDALALLLPTRAHPRRGEPPTEAARALARLFVAEFSHVKGLDEGTLTTVSHETASGPSLPGGRYQLALVPCVGDEDDRRALRGELERGLRALSEIRATGSKKEESRERDLLRADP